MAGSDVGGFAGGMMQAAEFQQNTTANSDAHNINMQNLAKGKLDIQQTQQLLDAQTAAMMELKNVGSTGGPATGAGGPAVSGVAGQSYKASDLAFAAGESYMRHGLIQQGSEFMERGAKLAESGASLEKHQAEQSLKMWQHVGSVLETVHDGSPTASQEWDQVRMTFPLMFPEEAKHPEVQKFLQKPYDPQTIDLLKRASVTAAEQAEQQKTKAESKHLAAQTRWDEAGVGLRKAETREHDARATAISKAGGKPPTGSAIKDADSLIEADYPGKDPKGYHLYSSEIAERAQQLIRADIDKDTAYKQAYEEVKSSGKLENLPDKPSAKDQKAGEQRNEMLDDIDDLMGQIDEDPSIVGLSGRWGEVKEWGSTTATRLTGGVPDENAPATKFGAGMHALMTMAPQALGTKGRMTKDEKATLADITNVRKMMTSPETAKAKLKALRDIIARQQGKTISGKGDKVGPHGAVMREGTFGGKKVVQYADGTVDYPEGK